jgi:hypothetical protein
MRRLVYPESWSSLAADGNLRHTFMNCLNRLSGEPATTESIDNMMDIAFDILSLDLDIERARTVVAFDDEMDDLEAFIGSFEQFIDRRQVNEEGVTAKLELIPFELITKARSLYERMKSRGEPVWAVV